MAFKIRCEFWKLSNSADGVATVVLDRAFAPAVEHDAATVSAAALPIPSSREAYAMSVLGISGAATVEVGSEPTGDAAYGRYIAANTLHWFIVQPDSLIFVTEYV